MCHRGVFRGNLHSASLVRTLTVGFRPTVVKVVIRLFARISLVTLVLAMTSRDVAAQSAVCDTVRPGDTASEIARRLTGRAESRHQPWFRVIDRARMRVIPRARYDRMVAGWQVCIPAARFIPLVLVPSGGPSTPLRTGPQWIVAPQPIRGDPAPRHKALGLALLCFAPAIFGAAIGFGWESVERFVVKRRAVERELLDFGAVFISHFERPLLVDGAAARPIRVRLRSVARRRRLDILIAPAAGRRYPNLDDHRRNVEYDVDRIAHRLRHHPFVRGPLHAEGRWVVIPFQFGPGLKTGAVV
jgi:hypothetical protein